MKLKMRAYQGEADYWRIRTFLRQVYLLNQRREFNWQVSRFDYWRWHGIENIHPMKLQEVIFLWETSNGQIAAVLNPEGPGDVFLQVHPNYDTPELAGAMLATAEQCLAITKDQGQRRLRVWANAQNAPLNTLLADSGYQRGEWPEYQRWRSLSEPIRGALPAPGYTIRSLGDVEELPARSLLSWKAFHPDEPDEHYQGWHWYPNVQRAPLYRRDLDLVAVAPDGELASFCTVWFDDVTRCATFEPVGTAPAHQRRGLASAVMGEGMRRAKRLGADLAAVGSYSQSAGALYASLGFSQYDLSYPWTKEI